MKLSNHLSLTRLVDKEMVRFFFADSLFTVALLIIHRIIEHLVKNSPVFYLFLGNEGIFGFSFTKFQFTYS